VMLQRDGVYLTMGPRDMLRLFASYYGKRSLDPDALLERLTLTRVAKTGWRRLSGGEQQKLKLAMAIIGRPEVAFLDEPTAAVDAEARATVRVIIDELRADGCCVLVSTHELLEAEKTADRVLIMESGTIVAAGSPDELRQQIGTATDTIRFAAAPALDVSGLAERLQVEVSEERRGHYVAQTAPSPAAIAALTAWFAEHDLTLDDLRAGRASLEDVYLQLTSGATAPATNTGPRERSERRGRR
jgi:ABC-2 type transport system ATP-binding protein